MPVTVVARQNEFVIQVNKAPEIGGYRGPAGAVEIIHSGNKPFTELSQSELQHLANCIHTILVRGYSESHVHNVLVFAKEGSKAGLKLNFIPYPKCNLREKIQGFIHYFFGGKSVTDAQYQNVVRFWKNKCTREDIFRDVPGDFTPPCPKKKDPFCDPKIIQKQLIREYAPKSTSAESQEADAQRYYLLADKRPLGNHHTLVVNSGESGHSESALSLFHRLCIVQGQFVQFKRQGDKSAHYVERFGNALRGVLHTHSHAIGLKVEPTTFRDRVCQLFRSIFPKMLSDSQFQLKLAEHRALS